MTEVDEDQSRVRLGHSEPYEGESISHYLGRLRRLKANSLPSAYSLGQLVQLRATVGRWEKLYFIPFPSDEQLELLGKLIGVESSRLTQMLPSQGKTHQPRPIKLCGACYAEVPCHRIAWQAQSKEAIVGCDRHSLRLLVNCPQCKRPFSIPSLWSEGKCENCSLPFAKMSKFQRAL
jgi:hypothetical protein